MKQRAGRQKTGPVKRVCPQQGARPQGKPAAGAVGLAHYLGGKAKGLCPKLKRVPRRQAQPIRQGAFHDGTRDAILVGQRLAQRHLRGQYHSAHQRIEIVHAFDLGQGAISLHAFPHDRH